MQIDAASGYLALARIASFEKKTDQLEDLYRKAVESNPRDYQALITLAGFYRTNGLKKLDAAEKILRDAVKLQPDRVAAHSGLVSLLAFQERWQDLDVALAQAQTCVPDNLYPYYQLGITLLWTGKDLPRAEHAFRNYLTQEIEPGWPLHSYAWWRLALILEKEGRKSEAIAALETSIRLKSDFEDAKKDLKRLK